MTDYNDGNWHGWSGDSKNPGVHDKSTVEAVWHDKNRGTAGLSVRLSGADVLGISLAWAHVIRFRVTNPYREPRAVWLVGNLAFDSRDKAEKFLSELRRDHPETDFGPKWEPRLFREVLE